jgi:hypothetical protein
MLYMSIDNGANWTVQYSEENSQIVNITCSDTAIYGSKFNAAGSQFQGIVRSINDGVTLQTPSVPTINGVAGGRRVFVSQDDSLAIYTSTTSGTEYAKSVNAGTVTLETFPASNTILDVAFNQDAQKVLFGTNDRLWISLNNLASILQTQPAGNVQRTWQAVAII